MGSRNAEQERHLLPKSSALQQGNAMPIFNSGAVRKSQTVGGTIVGAELDRFRMAPRAESSLRPTGRAKSPWSFSGKWSLLGRLAQAEQVTAFTTDIALLLKAGMRI